jgi:hypothetical protein
MLAARPQLGVAMTGEPTLHYGDQSADGWVEYAQQLLLGVVGNQTWSVLRGGEQAAVGTDGHQHQDTDAVMHAVFYTELSPHGQTGEYVESTDSMFFLLSVVGSQPIPSDEYNIWVNFESDANALHSAKVPLKELNGKPEAQAGDMLWGEVADLKTLLGGSGHYTYEATVAPGISPTEEMHSGDFTIP